MSEGHKESAIKLIDDVFSDRGVPPEITTEHLRDILLKAKAVLDDFTRMNADDFSREGLIRKLLSAVTSADIAEVLQAGLEGYREFLVEPEDRGEPDGED